MKKRNAVVCVLLSIITCGIYHLIWMCHLNNEVNQMIGNEQYTGGAEVILFNILTCGIYGIFWSYKMGECLNKEKGSDNYTIMFLLLSIFQLDFVNFIIMQDAINHALTEKE